ncbi:MAG: site-specific DNA-methyltransferase [Planctomycetes bacterium]|nr:site-specific DNA-methyltransferase [Planctomycetota bacterium]
MTAPIRAPRRPEQRMTDHAPSWRLEQADCLAALTAIPSAVASLVYLDPPFNTGVRRQGRSGLAFADRFDDIGAWRAFMEPRLRAAHRVLAEDGSLLLHVDWRTSHHARFMLDEIFGADNFVNHLVWSYGLGGSGPRSFARKHDDILLYGRSDAYWFEAPRVPARSARLRGRTKKATDVLDIAALNNMAIERTGWPTQKPLALLDVLVRACCRPNGLVVDPTCGSGTTLVAAVRSGRRALGIDISAEAIAIARGRLEGAAQRVTHPTAAQPRVRRQTAAGQQGLARSA